MSKLTFPTDIFAGLVFNDFVNRNSSLLHTYSKYAVTIKKITRCYALVMDDNVREVINIDHRHETPRWMTYEIERPATVEKLNWAITSGMTCISKGLLYQKYKHQSGLCIHIMKGSRNGYTYLLYWAR